MNFQGFQRIEYTSSSNVGEFRSSGGSNTERLNENVDTIFGSSLVHDDFDLLDFGSQGKDNPKECVWILRDHFVAPTISEGARKWKSFYEIPCLLNYSYLSMIHVSKYNTSQQQETDNIPQVGRPQNHV